ncbi:MAG: PepSY domain-containing protein [Campylobacterales bacterium]|nr:PepSY domain-containing protein [Campylobacterales bacterium]
MQKKIWFYTHWLLGLVAGFILVIVGVSGALLSYEKEIMGLMNQKSFRIEASANEKLSPNVLLNAFKKVHPDAVVVGLRMLSDPNASAAIMVQGAKEGGKNMLNYYINPYSAELLPEARGDTFFRVVLEVHRRLLLGEVGKQIVAASTVALLILSFSGIYLYWGSIRKSLKSSLSINFKAKGRGFLYKLHSALGLWGLLFFILISLTGLTWSYEWYRTSLYRMVGVEAPQHGMHHGGGKKRDSSSMPSGQKNSMMDGGTQSALIAQAWELFEATRKGEYSFAFFRLPNGKGNVEFMYLDKKAPHSRAFNTLLVDAKEGTVLSHVRYDDKRVAEQVMGSMLPLHSGEFFGWSGRLLIFLSSLSMVLFGVTGLMLYLDRRKKARKKAALRI